jgi:very-short-patch-repair endonuclease
VSHAAAAALHGFDRYRPGPLELTVTRHLRPPRGVKLHRVESLSSKELATVQGICVTSPTRTLLDLAAVDTEPMVHAAVDQALRRKWTTLEKLDVATERAAGRRGVAFLRELVKRYRGGDGPSESELEARVRELLEDEGLPRPETQRVVKVGGRVRRIDFRFPGTRVLIEADGYAHHSSPDAFEKDRDRNNALIARGFVVLHWTWAMLRDQPEVLLAQLRATLGR